MSDFPSYMPEVLNNHRISVTDWLHEAVEAIETFSDENTGSYFRDSKQADASKTLTTPARSYMALTSASRHFPVMQSGGKKTWVDKYVQFAPNIPVALDGAAHLINSETKLPLNNFELAKLSDLRAADDFVGRFHSKIRLRSKLPAIEGKISKSIKLAIKEIAKRGDGEAYIDRGDPDTKHFFVSLHLLRAAHSHAIELDCEDVAAIVAAAKQFCIKQCYYASRTVQHRADPARLAFAGVIYCQYEDDIDPDLILAVSEALAAFQQPTGNWPAIHPILRKEDLRNPWYIATHDLALCLSWLYFQSRVPEAARIVLLQMMENYFLKWVIPTFRQSEGKAPGRLFRGWTDDRATGGDMVVGWASAVVCHFLANYLDVLDDVINRRVIESISLQAYAQKYLVEEGQPSSNPRFSARAGDGRPLPIWIDLPPHSWSRRPVDVGTLELKITSKWTDPTKRNKIASAIASQVMKPIYNCSEFIVGPKSVGVLDGPPGTRKTSLVTAVADILQWPYIPVPASVFFDHGFDMMESRASEVFRRLNFLTYCVIFFDEFEEFFKERGTEAKPGTDERDTHPLNADSRTIAAFTTSAMLPRLQELHDRKKCIIFLATNHLEKIDEAIVRPGRFDYSLFVDHPKVKRFVDDDSFFKYPGLRTLEKLKIDYDAELMVVKEPAKLDRIATAVKGALAAQDVQKALKTFNESDAVRTWSKEPVSNDASEYYVWFRFVEAAMEAAGERIDAGGNDVAAQVAAASKLKAEIKYYSGKGRRGPATLDGLTGT